MQVLHRLMFPVVENDYQDGQILRSGYAEALDDGDVAIAAAVDEAPSTTRAKLRGDFIRRAKERRRDFTVDWVHLKLNDQAQRTVLCKDQFRYEDERVQKLIDSL